MSENCPFFCIRLSKLWILLLLSTNELVVVNSYDLYDAKQNFFNAREDARVLQEIVDMAEITRETLSRHSFTLTYIIEVQGFREKTEKLLQTWRPLLEERVVSEYIAEKAANSGLSFDDVRRAFTEGGEAGAKRVLTERTAERKARVTNWTTILDSICRYLRREEQQ